MITLSFFFWGLAAFVGWQDYIQKRDPSNTNALFFIKTFLEMAVQVTCILSILFAYNQLGWALQYKIVNVTIVFSAVFFLEYYRKQKAQVYLPVLCLSLYFCPRVIFLLEARVVFDLLAMCFALQLTRFILMGLHFRLLFSRPPQSLKGAPLYFLTIALLAMISMGFERVFSPLF